MLRIIRPETTLRFEILTIRCCGFNVLRASLRAAMSMKADRYSAKNEVDEFEGITEKLSADLRKSIRALVRKFTYDIGNENYVFTGEFPYLVGCLA